jgi:hypothetical protein
LFAVAALATELEPALFSATTLATEFAPPLFSGSVLALVSENSPGCISFG